jgi:type IV secretion system protein TrbL
VIFAGFPNPIGWAIDKVTGFVGGAATAGFEAIIGGLVAWVVDAVVWIVGGVFDFFLDSTDPNVQADWFITGTGPYATTTGIGATLLVLFVLVGIAQGALNGDVAGMVRSIALDLPVSVLGMVGLVTITQALIRLTDVLSSHVLANFEGDVADFGAVVASLSSLSGGTSTAFVVFILGLVTVLAGLVLVAELVIRAALVYLVVALAPLVFATRLWPATKGAARKLLDLLCALILSKLVIAVALAVAAAAAVGTGSGGEVTALPEPEVFAEDPGGSVTQAVGILLTATAAFGVAAFSPLLIAKLLPLTEAAVVAHGVRGGPVRAGHQGLMMANTVQMVSGNRLRQLASGSAASGAVGAGAGTRPASLPAGSEASAGAGAGSATAARGGAAAGAAGGPAGLAAAAAARAGKAAKGAATRGARTAAQAAEPAHEGPPAEGPARRRSSPPERPSGPAGPRAPQAGGRAKRPRRGSDDPGEG